MGIRYKWHKSGRMIAFETVPSSTKPKRREPFVMITAAQAARLEQVANATTIKIFLQLLFLNYRAHGQPFALPRNIHRNKRHRALIDLEKSRLISVRCSRGKATLITIRP